MIGFLSHIGTPKPRPTWEAAPRWRGSRPFEKLTEEIVRSWYAPPSAARHPLHPLLLLGSRLYRLGLYLDQQRARLHRLRLPATIISVGNLAVGGTGKTPLTLWLARHLHSRGLRPAILSRGYGGASSAVRQVPATGDTQQSTHLFGDEPVLMATKAPYAPVWVGRERGEAGMSALRASRCDVLILDDGFQHLKLERDLDLVLLDAERPFGNGAVLPLGPLREPIEHLDRAHVILLTRADDTHQSETTRLRIRERFPGKAVFTCRHRLTGFQTGLHGATLSPEILQGRCAVAFAGIARADSFFHSLHRLGIRMKACFPFPDHHRYDNADAARLIRSTEAHGAEFLITTEKDQVRLPAELRQAVVTARLEIDFGSDQPGMVKYVEKAIGLG